jgi:hypothetical protein
MLIEGFDSIHSVLAISNAFSLNMSKTHILDTKTISTGISLPCLTITKPADSIACQDINFLSPSFLLPLNIRSRCRISYLEADNSSSDSSLHPPCCAGIVTSAPYNISLIHEYFDLSASTLFYNTLVLNFLFFSYSIYFIFHFYKQHVEVIHE